MAQRFQMDENMYHHLLGRLNELHQTDKRGLLKDFDFFHNDLWLADTAVVEELTRHKGEWQVNLVFAYTVNPMRFIRRQITSYSCPRKATLFSSLMRRLAAKDQRGTQEIRISSIFVCKN
ncbi:hypothetical protein [Runella aurantiaca]|uniref:Uncharacterized protein n=1 Tax=Runella aurantiaca TaxID=2282308 RepID=A0A369IFU6_9BACT|nr:hypothetical protein [Runella aurantiaca]RDB06363.1 hypothetical protein DVG78_08860 [Runella aurantiaca]